MDDHHNDNRVYRIKETIGLRVTAEEEIEGLDSTEHGLESGYPDFVSRELH